MFYNEIDESYIKKYKWKLLWKWCSRKCYEHKWDKTLVFKIAKNMSWLLHNLIERDISKNLSIVETEKKTADILAISKCWKIILQERCEPLDKLPEEVYEWWRYDVKESNFWIIDWTIVKLDYWQNINNINALISNDKVLLCNIDIWEDVFE